MTQFIGTAQNFNSQHTGYCKITESTPTPFYVGLVKNCPIHGIELINVQHPAKAFGVAMCRYCPKCQEPSTRFPEGAEL